MNKTDKTVKIAFGGIAAALAVVLLLLNNLLPSSTAAITACSAAVIFLVSVEFGTLLAVAVYAVSAVCAAVFVTANPNVFWMFTLVFGIYCVIKSKIDKIRTKPVKTLIKLSLFVFCPASYAVVWLLLLDGTKILAEYKSYWIIIGAVALSAVCAVVFFLFDKCLTQIAQLYFGRFRKRIFK